MGFSDVDHLGGLDDTLLSQGCAHEVAPTVGTVGGTYNPRTGERRGATNFLGAAQGSTAVTSAQ